MNTIVDAIAMISLALIVIAAPLGAVEDEWRDALGAADISSIASEGASAGITAKEVSSVMAGSLAEKMDMRVGDQLVALDGLRTYDHGEWDLVRYRCRSEPGPVRVLVLRNGVPLELVADRTQPVRRLGFDFRPRTAIYRSELVAAGFPDEPEGIDAATFPARDGSAIIAWKYAATASGSTVDRAWISRLAACFRLLSAQRWADAETASSGIGVPDACPNLQHLVRFYHSLAAYHAGGRAEPDPAHYGETLAYQVIHYPYPPLHLPALGAFTHPDAAFIDALTRLAKDPARYADSASGSVAALTQQPEEGEYQFSVRRAVIDQLRHGGWPYRSYLMHDAAQRARILEELRKDAGSGAPTAMWSRVCLVSATLVDATTARRKDPLSEALEVAAPLRAQSPLLAYLATDVLVRGAPFLDLLRVREGLREAFVDDIVSSTTPPSPLLASLRAHSAGLEFLSFGPTEYGWRDHLWEIHAALSRELPLDDVRKQLATPDATRTPDEQRNVLRVAGDYFRDDCQPLDMIAMTAFAAPGKGAGQLTDVVSDLMYWHSRGRHDQSWIFFEPATTHAEREIAALPSMAKAAAAIRWDDTANVGAAIEAAYLAGGTPAAALYLADQCEQHGQQSVSAALRARIKRFFDHAQELANNADFNRMVRLQIDEGELVAAASSAATSAYALAAGERYLKRDKDPHEWDSIRLRIAQAHALAGQVEQAVDDLCRSFAAERIDKKPVYPVGDHAIEGSVPFRTWLLRRLAADPGFTDAVRNKIIGAAIPNLVDDDFAAVLGKPRATLGGKPKPGPADDF